MAREEVDHEELQALRSEVSIMKVEIDTMNIAIRRLLDENERLRCAATGTVPPKKYKRRNKADPRRLAEAARYWANSKEAETDG